MDGFTVQPRPLPQVRAPLETFGGGSALPPEAGGPLQSAINIFVAERNKADQVHVTDAGAQLSALETRTLYHPTTGVLNLQGKNASGALDLATQQWNEGAAQIEAGLTNDQQKQAFQRMAQGHWASIDAQVQRHAATEAKQYDVDSTNSYIANEQTNAAKAFADPLRVQQAIDNQRAAIADHADRAGWSDPEIQQQTAKVTSTTRLSVLDQILNAPEAVGGGDLRAQRYFQTHQEDFVGNDLLSAERLTEAGSVRGESQRQADAITTVASTRGEALAQLPTIENPAVRDATRQRIDQHYADVDANRREVQQNATDAAGQILKHNGGDFDKVPVSLIDAMSNEQYSRTRALAEQIRNPVVRTNHSLYVHMAYMANGNPAQQAEFQHYDFDNDPKLKGQFSDTDINKLYAWQEQLRLNRGIGAAPATARDPDHQAMHEEEQIIVRSAAAHRKAVAANAGTANNPALAQYLTPPPAVLPATQWMRDSAAVNPKYAGYLRTAGVDIDSSIARDVAPRPMVPGAPIARPKAPPFGGLHLTPP